MISVIMPVYNSEKYLREAIESILKQTYKDFEFIIINDGSTDSSLNIIKEYEGIDKRIKVLSRENRGLIYTLNEGLRISKNKYIVRMDSDDISTIDRFKKQVEYMEKNKNIDLSGGRIKLFGNDDVYSKNKSLNAEFDIYKDKVNEDLIIKNGCSVVHGTFIFRKEIIDQLSGYDSRYKFAEDLYFQIKLLEGGKHISFMDEMLLQCREHYGSKSSIENIENVQETIKIRIDYINKKIKLKDREVIIWGCGSGGLFTLEYLKKELKCKNIRLLDKYKKGKLKGISIENKLQLKGNELIIIATKPGKVDAIIELEKNKCEYITVVT